MKARITSSEVEGKQYPPLGCLGVVRLLPNQKVAFAPVNRKHYPPDCDPDEFDYYELKANQITLVSF